MISNDDDDDNDDNDDNDDGDLVTFAIFRLEDHYQKNYDNLRLLLMMAMLFNPKAMINQIVGKNLRIVSQ